MIGVIGVNWLAGETEVIICHWEGVTPSDQIGMAVAAMLDIAAKPVGDPPVRPPGVVSLEILVTYHRLD